jgi:hypothetical protein
MRRSAVEGLPARVDGVERSAAAVPRSGPVEGIRGVPEKPVQLKCDDVPDALSCHGTASRTTP